MSGLFNFFFFFLSLSLLFFPSFLIFLADEFGLRKAHSTPHPTTLALAVSILFYMRA